MQAYPNFYPNQQMNQPNMYPNYNPPMANPYVDRMAQLQQYQQSLQPQMQQSVQPMGLIGKPVNDFSEIKADDVPMNGTPAVFVKSDMSEIEVRIWGKDGIIRPTSYKPVVEQNQVEPTNMPQMDLNTLNEDVRALREDILARLDAIEKSVAKPNAKTKKAEVGTDE